MQQRIIYTTPEGGLAVLIPAPQARQRVLVSAAIFEAVEVPATEEAEAYIEQQEVSPEVWRDQTDEEFAWAVARKDVPAGLPFKILDAAEIPTDRTFRAAWEIDPALLTDGVGSESTNFEETP